MPRPTLLDLAREEWALLRDYLLDTYCAAVPEMHDQSTRAYAPEFIYLVRANFNLDLTRFTPAYPESLDCVIRESNILQGLIADVQDDDSELMND